ncbi:antA/AntB antirepressor family protein [Marinobacter sp. 1-3A]|uniref:antA/AntB antirepressor family protein n=1 Tax=Marinobacter sp. 1-3A TaxID=2582920 RepID=UPI001904CE86|nr:antA/AntB antirepressor family protein [Marinobacter sp. 1-3A]MBK1874627.1 antA/AntB antirepressor family protein [Marinobacter sp. 1-3A]
MTMPTKYHNNPFNNAVEIIHENRNGQAREFCDARELHSALKVETRFATWFERRVSEYQFVEGQDYFPFLGNRNDSRKGKARAEYQISLNMAKELAMVERTEVGRQVRQYFIQVEEYARRMLEEQANQVQPIEQVKDRIKDNGKFKFLIILQEQSRATAKKLSQETDPVERYNLHCQLRQINGALGIPTLPLDAIALPEK